MNNSIKVEGPLIVGAGLAGLFTALKLAPMPCTIINPEPVGIGASTSWAQGGIAAAVGKNDSPAAHKEDTITAGAGLVVAEIAGGVTSEAQARIDDLIAFGAPFDRDADGNLVLSKEAAHSTARVVRVKGDQAGRAVMETLIAKARQTPSITFMERWIADHLISENGLIKGVIARQSGVNGAEYTQIFAKYTVLATGGLGGLYKVTTNPSRVRGHGIGMAARAGAIIADPEFVQFHPTAIASDHDPCRLATEALRGHGSSLIDQKGHRFMFDVHPDGELAPRDIVARAIFAREEKNEPVYLDTRQAIGAHIADEFPAVMAYCLEAGIDPIHDPIPVRVAQHYHMGGVACDAVGKTNLESLYVAGEVSSTGLHGANRLASNSLLEAVVYGNRIAQDLQGKPISPAEGAPSAIAHNSALPDKAAVETLRNLMSQYVGVTRDASGLTQAVREITALMHSNQNSSAFQNMATAAYMVAAAALIREESRGGHYRRDFPDQSNKFKQRSEFTLSDLQNKAKT